MNRKVFFFFGAVITPCMCFGVPRTIDMHVDSGLLSYKNLAKYARLSNKTDTIKVVDGKLSDLTRLVENLNEKKLYTTGVWENDNQVYDATGARTSTQVVNGPLVMHQGVLLRYSCVNGTGEPPSSQIVTPEETVNLAGNNTCAKNNCDFYAWDCGQGWSNLNQTSIEITTNTECRAVYQCDDAECGTIDNPEQPMCQVEDCHDPTSSINEFNVMLAERGKTWQWRFHHIFMSGVNNSRRSLLYCKLVLENPGGLCFTFYGDIGNSGGTGYYQPDAWVDCDIDEWQNYTAGIELHFIGGGYKYDPGYAIIVPFAKSGNPSMPSLAGIVPDIVCDSGKEFKGVYREQSTSSDQYWDNRGEPVTTMIYGYQNTNEPVYVVCE